ncbi:facilitated trehalose transporter Tret1-2 homolog [Danaus plexippus]|uniref:facilitated trehalose transporter Tret1-2 homolog n=1 Tax=Danaus plexippus TaxID=13037 RepID=UPI002AB28E92|nr:facilitated trehalose transporter Tret1-2 homolog [Danaus plexippus]XP_061377294.1 facilitated trehalose transporter Tret1-2 homolog [Danaus plexippus]XP_061377295.1 facilitated trehalose transporter Tret1-2 homolog [Danaus plexippus]XP_061377296.1 facilitated trehalose transporter Tret1-2 homolog [Danaus plexippus]
MEHGRFIQYMTAFALSLSTATLGVSSAWPTPVIPKFHRNETNVQITDNEIATMLAMSAPGFVAGSLLTRFVADSFGTQTTVLASALPIATGTVIAVLATQAWLLFIMKFLWGFGTGMVSTVVTMYLAEIADKDIRGTLAVGTRFMFNLGSLLVISIGPFLSFSTLNYCILGLPVIFFTACLWIPESPYYYLKKGKVEQARRVLIRLKGEENAEIELESLKADVNKEMRHSGTVCELFTGRQYRRPLVIALGLKVTQIMTGTLTIQQYLGRIMQDANINMKLSTILVIFGIVKFVVGIMSSILVDRVGRRPLLIYSYFAFGLCVATAGSYFFLLDVVSLNPSVLRPYGIVPFVAIILCSVVSTLGFNSIISIISAEVFPLNVKPVAMTTLNVFGGFAGFSVAKTYQAVKNISGLCGAFWMFSLIAFSGAVFSYFVVPETRGKSLREIQEIFQINDNIETKIEETLLSKQNGGTELNVLNKEYSL